MKHGDITIDEAVTVLDRLGGRSVVNAMVAGQEIKLVKYGGFTLGQVEAGINALGGEQVMQGLISGALRARRVGEELLIEPACRPLFDRHGRRIPPDGLKGSVRDTSLGFHFEQPHSNYQGLARLMDLGLLTEPCSTGVFMAHEDLLLRQLQGNKQVAGILNGVHMPVLIPRTQISDYGQSAERFIEAAAVSYRREFPDRSFAIDPQNQLAGKVSIVAGSHHEQLVKEIARGCLPGIYFPNPLMGFSILAQHEQMSSLPAGFLLSGVIDTAVAWVMYPDIFGQPKVTGHGQIASNYDCSANQWQAPWSNCSLHFLALSKKARVGYRNYESGSVAREDFSGGLLFAGTFVGQS